MTKNTDELPKFIAGIRVDGGEPRINLFGQLRVITREWLDNCQEGVRVSSRMGGKARTSYLVGPWQCPRLVFSHAGCWKRPTWVRCFLDLRHTHIELDGENFSTCTWLPLHCSSAAWQSRARWGQSETAAEDDR